jgi:hypothetical protein
MIATSDRITAAEIAAVASMVTVVLAGLVMPLVIRRVNRRGADRATAAAAKVATVARQEAQRLFEQVKPPSNGHSLGQVAELISQNLDDHGKRLGRMEVKQDEFRGKMDESLRMTAKIDGRVALQEEALTKHLEDVAPLIEYTEQQMGEDQT